MKVLYIHRTQGNGVERVHIQGIAKAFERRRWRVDILGPPGIKISTSKKSPAHPQKRRKLYDFLADGAGEVVFELLELFYNFVSFFRVLMKLLFLRYDLVYERYSLFHFATVFAARLAGVPIVIEVNDSVTIERSRKLILRSLAGQLEKRILNAAMIVVTISGEFSRRLRQSGVRGEKIIVTPNAVDSEQWADIIRKCKGKGIVRIVFAAAFVRWHRPDFMIRAFNDLSGLHENVELIMAGDGPELDRARSLCEKSGISAKVKFTGWLESDEIQKLLLTCDIGVMAHSNPHGSPMKIFEYMAAGLAVAAPDYSPILEVVEDQVTGLIFRRLKTDDLVDCLSILVLDRGLRKQMGKAAREYVLKNHTWDNNLSEIFKRLDTSPPLILPQYGHRTDIFSKRIG